MNLSLQGKNAWVGGSSAGIGRAVAIELALLGANVTLVARTETSLRAALSYLDTTQGQLHDYVVADYQQSDDLLEKVRAVLVRKPLHILVNNTGGPPGGPITEATAAAFLSAAQQHLLCNHLLAQALLPAMKTAGFGRIINVISTSVKEPLDGLGVSNTTRWAVAGWAKTWANEVAAFGITVNNVLPGYTRTGRLESLIEKQSASKGVSVGELEEQWRHHTPIRRFADPSEVAAAVAFLATPAASYINGVNLPVDGGRTRSL
jgi:3-oxoacyl-[acyl-carrier protein] reductase